MSTKRNNMKQITLAVVAALTLSLPVLAKPDNTPKPSRDLTSSQRVVAPTPSRGQLPQTGRSIPTEGTNQLLLPAVTKGFNPQPEPPARVLPAGGFQDANAAVSR